ncbi:tyrosine-type recombinase/integrase [Cellulomonas hominis]
MARPRTPIGTFGAITTRITAAGVVARCRFRDQDGHLRQVSATASSARAAERALKTRLTVRDDRTVGMGPLTADTPFAKLVEFWLEDLDLEGRLAATTRELYEWNMRHLVLPTFEPLTLREITVSRVDRFLKTQAKVSYNRAKQSKVVLSSALGLAVRYEAIARNPVASTSRLRKPAHTTLALSKKQVQAIRAAVQRWRTGAGLSGPKPDGQMGPIIEVMLGTSARIGEVLAIRKCDVDVTVDPPTVTLCGTIVSPKATSTYRQDHPKTSTSVRTIAVPSFTAEALRQRLVAVAGEEPEHLLFFSRNHTPLTTNNVRRRLRAILAEAGIGGVTPHAFRRTVATVVDRAAGTDLAADLLGHTSPAITKAHYIDKDIMVDPRTAEVLEELAPDQLDETGKAL